MVLSTTVDEEYSDLTNCLEESLKKNWPLYTFVPPRLFKDSLFPFFESKTAPKSVEELSGLLEKPSIQSRIDALGVRVVLAVYDSTVANAWLGDIVCSGGGCLGAQTRDVRKDTAIAIWDLQNPAGSRAVAATESGEDSFGVLFFLPLSAYLTTEVNVCKELSNQIVSYLAGDETTTVKPVPVDNPTDVKATVINPLYGAHSELILIRVLEGCRAQGLPFSRCLSVAVSPDGKNITNEPLTGGDIAIGIILCAALLLVGVICGT